MVLRWDHSKLLSLRRSIAQRCQPEREQRKSILILNQNGEIQAIITYKWSDNVIRTRVSTIRLEYIRENQLGELGKRFDEQSGAVMLARMAAKKAEV